MKHVLIVGRFQGLHNGHVELIKEALTLGDRLSILVGSANASPSQRNPFPIDMRVKWVENVVRQLTEGKPITCEVFIGVVDDYPQFSNAQWGIMLRDKVTEGFLFTAPDITHVLTGDADETMTWFPEGDVVTVGLQKELQNYEGKLICATYVRELLWKKDYTALQHVVPSCTWGYREVLRHYLKEVGYADLYPESV